MTERRYDEHEVELIFRSAAEGRALAQATSDSSMTLAQLQDIAREVGLSPDSVTAAARSLDIRATSQVRKLFWLPIGVGHTVELGRELSEDEWQRLVSRFRVEFEAQGKAGSEGPLRYWRNGRLRIFLELGPGGHRLTFRTLNERAQALMAMGFALLGVTTTTTISVLFKGTLGGALPGIAMLGLIGVGAMLAGAVRLPSWARLRAKQMQTLGEEAAR